jgi:hypothetical protein
MKSKKKIKAINQFMSSYVWGMRKKIPMMNSKKMILINQSIYPLVSLWNKQQESNDEIKVKRY